jgi:hypothetical protein
MTPDQIKKDYDISYEGKKNWRDAHFFE